MSPTPLPALGPPSTAVPPPHQPAAGTTDRAFHALVESHRKAHDRPAGRSGPSPTDSRHRHDSRPGDDSAQPPGSPATPGDDKSPRPAGARKKKDAAGRAAGPPPGVAPASGPQDPPALVLAPTPAREPDPGPTGRAREVGAATSGTAVDPRAGKIDAAAPGALTGPAPDGQGGADSAGRATAIVQGDAPTGPEGHSDKSDHHSADHQPPPSGAPVPAGGGPANRIHPTAGAGGAGRQPGAPGAHGAVPGQIQPQLLRLVSRGDGTHRVSLQLHPAELGEVRVTVVVKDGAVDVSLAAAPAAQDALRAGSDQLRSLLGGSGHTLGRLVVQDLPGTITAQGSAAQSTATQSTATQSGGPGHQGQQQPGPGTGQSPGSVQAQTSGHGGQQGGQQPADQHPGRAWPDRSGGDPSPSPPAATARPGGGSASPVRTARTGLDLRI